MGAAQSNLNPKLAWETQTLRPAPHMVLDECLLKALPAFSRTLAGENSSGRTHEFSNETRSRSGHPNQPRLPLPDGWEEAYSEEHNRYYDDHRGTQERTWRP